MKKVFWLMLFIILCSSLVFATPPTQLSSYYSIPNLCGLPILVMNGNLSYVVTSNGTNGGSSLTVFNVSNPVNIVQLGYLLMSNLSSPSSMAFNNGFVFVLSSSNDSLSVFNVSNPASLSFISSIVNTTSLNQPVGIAISNDLAFVVGGGNSLTIFNVSNPNNVVQLSYVVNGTSMLQPGDVAANNNSLVFVASNYYPISLAIFNVSNPLVPVQVGFYQNLSVSSGENFLTVDGDYVYLVSQPDDSLRVFNVSNPSSPVQIGYLVNSSLNLVSDVTEVDGIVYTSTKDYSGKIGVFGVQNKSAPIALGSINFSSPQESIGFNNNNVFSTSYAAVSNNCLEGQGFFSSFTRVTSVSLNVTNSSGKSFGNGTVSFISPYGKYNYSIVNGLSSTLTDYNVLSDVIVNYSSYALATTTKLFNTSFYSLNMSVLYPPQSVNVSLFDETTGLKINGSLKVFGQYQDYNYTVTNGNVFISGLVPDTYNFVFSATNYTTRNYVVVVPVQSYQNDSFYLLSSLLANAVTYTVTDLNNIPLQNVTVTDSLLIGNVTTVVESRATDISGTVGLTQNPTYYYTVTFSNPSYVTKSAYFQPTSTSYVVRLTGIDTANFRTLFGDVNYTISPSSSSINPGLTTFALSASSASGAIGGMTISDAYGNSSSFSGAYGGTVQMTLNLSWINTSMFYPISYSIVVNGSTINFSEPYYVASFNLSENWTLSNIPNNYNSTFGVATEIPGGSASGGAILIGVVLLMVVALGIGSFLAGGMFGRALGVVTAAGILLIAAIGFFPWTYAIMASFLLFFSAWVKGL